MTNAEKGNTGIAREGGRGSVTEAGDRKYPPQMIQIGQMWGEGRSTITTDLGAR